MRIFAFIAALLFLSQPALAFDPCQPNGYTPILQRLKDGPERAIFFKIAKCNQADNYILGTMHSDLPLVKKSLPSSVFDILRDSLSASFELKTEESMQIAVMTAMYYSPSSGQNLHNAIGDEMSVQLDKLLSEKRKDLNPLAYARMKPWAVGLLMSVPADENDGVHLDASLEKFAVQNNVPVYGLETVGEQLSVFTKLSEAEQIEFLRESINSFDINQKTNSELLEFYLSRNLNALQDLADKSFALMKNEALKRKLETTLITNRNKLMLERILPRLNTGRAFIAVGALHLPAEAGLLNQLEQLGYYILAVN